MTPGTANRIHFMAAPSAFASRQIRLSDWWTVSAIISFLAGLLTNLRFQFVGKASVGEIVLAVIALFAVLANIGKPRFWNRRMVLILSALCVSFCGYIISDLINSTPPDRLVRGWARIAFAIVDFVAIWALTRNSMVNLFAVCVGDALSTLLSYGEQQRDFLYNYKFHLAMPFTVLIMIVMPLLLRRRANMATGIAMIGVGMCHLRLDFRMAGGICILVGFILIARCMTASRLRSLYLALLALALILSSTAIAYLYTDTNTSFAERREGSNSARLSVALAGINAIERSPFFGLGSWVWDAEMWNVYAGNMGRANTADWTACEVMGPHSQLIQTWAEAGLLGVVFFVYYGKLLASALWLLVLRRNLDIMTPLFLYHLLLGLWNLLFSPFANLHRFAIGLALVISLQVLREHESSIRRAVRLMPNAAPPLAYPESGSSPVGHDGNQVMERLHATKSH
jgi:O-antigen ligase